MSEFVSSERSSPAAIPMRRSDDESEASEWENGGGGASAEDTHSDSSEDRPEQPPARSSHSPRADLAAASAARRLRTAMANTTAALRKELASQAAAAVAAEAVSSGATRGTQSGAQSGSQSRYARPLEGADLLPPPLPLMQASKKEFDSKRPKTGFGVDAVPCCRSPHHILTLPPQPEPLLTGITPEQRATNIAKLRQYDQERNDPNVPLSPLFINRTVYDCTASPTFSRRWRRGRLIGPDGSVTHCSCDTCIMYDQSLPHTVSSPLAPARPAATTGPNGAACNGEWIVDVRSLYTPTSPDDTTLVFESRFESGNLRTAFQVSMCEYDLTIRPDFNTTHHTQWYYFSVRNTRRRQLYKFNFINLVKPGSLYNDGMRPLLYSTIAASGSTTGGTTAEPKGWYRGGANLCYYENHIPRGSSRQKHYYTLSFTCEFDHDHDTVFFAYSYPYSFTSLNRDLHLLELDPHRSRYVKRRTLCKTLAGNDCDILTITDFDATPEEMRERKGIVYTARVHPGETNASWMMRGCLEYLTSSDPIAAALRSRFIFKLVPMLNVDGVVNGNYRCSLAGVDLNRHWKNPSPTIHPTIYATKQMIRRMAAVRPILMCVDLHGHSRKFNIFLYGCPKPIVIGSDTADDAPTRKKSKAAREREARDALASPMRLIERVFPRLLAEPLSQADILEPTDELEQEHAAHIASVSPSPSPRRALVQSSAVVTPPLSLSTAFHLKDCSFSISRGKESTARVVLWRELGLMNSFTLEASFAGASVGALKGMHFHTGHFEQMGRSLVATLWVYINPAMHESARRALCAVTPAIERSNGGDDSDDSSDSPDEVGLPLTVGRSEAAKRRKKQKQVVAERAAAKLGATAVTATKTAAATTAAMSARRASPRTSETKERMKALWAQAQNSDESDEVAAAKRRKKKRQAERAAAAAAAAAAAQSATNATIAAALKRRVDDAHEWTPATSTPNYFSSSSSSYYRSSPSAASTPVAMILSEEEDRAKLRGQFAYPASSPTTMSPSPSSTPSSPHHARSSHRSHPSWDAHAPVTARAPHRRSNSGSGGGPAPRRPKSAYPLATASANFGPMTSTIIIDSFRARRPTSAVGWQRVNAAAGSAQTVDSPARSPSPTSRAVEYFPPSSHALAAAAAAARRAPTTTTGAGYWSTDESQRASPPTTHELDQNSRRDTDRMERLLAASQGYQPGRHGSAAGSGADSLRAASSSTSPAVGGWTRSSASFTGTQAMAYAPTTTTGASSVPAPVGGRAQLTLHHPPPSPSSSHLVVAGSSAPSAIGPTATSLSSAHGMQSLSHLLSSPLANYHPPRPSPPTATATARVKLTHTGNMTTRTQVHSRALSPPPPPPPPHGHTGATSAQLASQARARTSATARASSHARSASKSAGGTRPQSAARTS